MVDTPKKANSISQTDAIILIVIIAAGVYLYSNPDALQGFHLPLTGDVFTTTTTYTSGQTTSGQTTTATTSSGPVSPPTISITFNKYKFNAGEGVVGAVYTNRAGTEIIASARLRGEAWVEAMRGITDASGRYAAAVAIQVPGIYEVKAEVQTVESNTATLTIKGLHISVNPDSTTNAFTVDVYSATTDRVLVIQHSNDDGVSWAVTQLVKTNFGGHAHFDGSGFAVGTYIFRAFDPTDVVYSTNQEWLTVT